MHNCIIVAADRISMSRLSYVLDFIFRVQLGMSYQIVHDHPKERGDTITFSYSDQINEYADFNIYSHGLLEENGIHANYLSVQKQRKWPYFFCAGDGVFDLPFDLFSMSFYLLTRYEEYLPHPKDRHGRFSARQSLAYREEFLTLPIIDLWVNELRKLIEKKHNIQLAKPRSIKRITIDVDQVFAFKYKSFRFLGGLIKDLAAARISTLAARYYYLKSQKDPFDTFEYLRDKLSSQRDHTRFFFLSNYLPPHDLNHVVGHPVWAQLVKKVNEFSIVGLHPSYTACDLASINKEKERLELALGSEVRMSRQHFIRINFPMTYRNLISAGILEDYSMSYPDSIGFRASTSFPFYWYDLEQERVTELVIYPDCAMDVTLRYYMTLQPDEAIMRLDDMRTHVRDVGGHFSVIWHNSSLSKAYGWEDWLPVFDHIIAAI